MISLGSFFAIPTTYTEKYVGFWVSFLLPYAVYFALLVLLLVIYRSLVQRPRVGSELTDFTGVPCGGQISRRGRHPAALAARGVQVPWTERAVMNVQRTFKATVVFLYFPLYNLNNGVLAQRPATRAPP